MPGFHILEVMAATRSLTPPVVARSGSPWAVPLLTLPKGGTLNDRFGQPFAPGTLLRDSHQIAKHASVGTSLYPSGSRALRDAIDADLLRFHDKVGPVTRRFAYYHLFAHIDAAGFAQLAEENGAPAWQARLLASEGVYARLKSYIAKGLGVSVDRARRAERYIDAECDLVATRLRSMRESHRAGEQRCDEPFLHSVCLAGADEAQQRPTLADLSFASLMAPVLGVPLGARSPPAHALGAEFVEKAERWREHPAGRYALRILERRDELAVPLSLDGCT